MLSFFLYIFIRTLVNLYKFKRALLAKFFYLILLVIIIIDTIVQFGNNRLYQYKFFFVFVLQLIQMIFDFITELIQAFNLLNQQNIYQNQRRVVLQANNLFSAIQQHIQNQNQDLHQGLTEDEVNLLQIIKYKKNIYEKQPDHNQQQNDDKTQPIRNEPNISVEHKQSVEMEVPVELNQNDKQIQCQSMNQQQKNSQQQNKQECSHQGNENCVNMIQIDLEQSNLGIVNQTVFNCIICESTIEENDDIYDLKCRHIFHAGCLKPWILNNSTCPLCRYQIREQLKNDENEQ